MTINRRTKPYTEIPPNRAQPVQFPERADYMAGYMPGFGDDLNVMADEFNATAVTVNNLEQSAKNSKESAEAAALVANSASNIKGVFKPGQTNALQNETWIYEGAFWFALTDTSATPQESSGDWASLSKHNSLTNRNESGAHPVSAIDFNERFDIGDRGNFTSSVDPVVNVNRNVDNATSGSGHCFSDSSLINRSGNVAYASYDARFTVSGVANYDHFAPFQNGCVIDTSGITQKLYGYVDSPLLKNGVVQNRYGCYVFDAGLEGDAELVSNYGIYIEELKVGGVQNFAIVTKGATKSLFEGEVIFQGGIKATSKISANSLEVLGLTHFNQGVSARDVKGLNSANPWVIDSSATAGLRVAIGKGSSYDFAIMTSGYSSFIATVPAGTNDFMLHGKVGFFGAQPSSKPTVSGSKGGNAALGSLIAALAALGLINDATT